MRFLQWIEACLTVYLRRLANLSRASVVKVVVLIFAILLAAMIGLPATVVLVLVAVFVLPALNSDIKNEIDREYTKFRK